MRISFLALALITGIALQAQIKKVDKLTGDTTYLSGFEKLYSKASWSGTPGEQVKVVASKDKTGFHLALWVQTAKSLSFAVTGRLRIKLEDGSIVDLKAAGSGAYDITDDLQAGSSISIFDIAEPDIDKLRSRKVTFIRLEGSSQNLEYDIKEKNQSAIADCIKKII